MPRLLALPLLPALLLLVGCSDYGIKGSPPDEEVSLGLEVDPAAVAFTSCGPRAQVVTLRSTGTGAVEITELNLAGEGWTLAPITVPFSIPGGEARIIELIGQDGDATLQIGTSLPDRPLIEVPLSALADGPPTAVIESPTDGQILASGAELVLSARVEDDVDAATALGIRWSSDVDGTISEAPASADGRVSASWTAGSRSTGSHQLRLEVTDSCGNVASDEVGVCQDEGYTVDELDLASWHLEGTASWDESTATLELTPAVTDAVGSAFAIDETVPGDAVSIAFRFEIGGGSGADGLSLTVLDSSRMTGFLGGTGCGIGYGGNASCTAGPALPGWSIEVDTWYNDGQDPTEEDHIMFTFDGDVGRPVAWAVLPEMEDTGWHLMEVEVGLGRVQAWIDGVRYLDATVSGFTPFPGYVGFTAGTGGATNRHRIDSLEVTAHVCE